MSRTSEVIVLLLLVLAPVHARGAVVPFTGSISIAIGDFPAVVLPGVGVATLNGSGAAAFPATRIEIPAGVFSTTTTIPLPNAFPIVQVRLSASNASALFSAGASPCGTPHPRVTCSGGGALHGRSGLVGNAFLDVFVLPPAFWISVPLGGVGGGSTHRQTDVLGLHLQSGAGWTTGTVSVLSLTQTFPSTAAGLPTAMAAGGWNLAGTAPLVQLVSPYAIWNSGTTVSLPVLTTWTLQFQAGQVPEPTFLLAVGVLGLAFRGRRLPRQP